jgi:hypothetical protein
VFALIAGVILVVSNAGSARSDLSDQAANAAETFIKGSPEVLAVLDRVRAASGCFARRNGVRTLLLDGTETTPAGLLPAQVTPVQYRFLLPDHLQETSQLFSQSYVFTFAGADYWQIPLPADLDMSRRAKRRALADWLILFLVRAPAEFPMTAALGKGAPAATAIVTFSNADNYSRRVSYDRKSWRPVMIEHDYTGNDGRVRVSRLTVSESATVEGCQLPRVVLRSLREGAEPTRIEFAKITINKDVSARDFQRR